MMRYQRVSSPDVLPLGDGKKPSLRACKEDYADDGGRIQNYSLFEIKSSRRRPASGSENPSPIRDHHFPHIFFPSDSPPAAHSDTQPSAPSTSASPGPAKAQSQHQINGGSHGGGSDVLLRWGHKKRSRGPRTEGRAPAAGEASSVQSRPVVKVQRRSSGAMPPPSGPHARVANLGEGMPGRDATASLVNGGVKERSGAPTRSEKRSPRRPSKKAQKASANPTPNGGSGTADGYANPEAKQPSDPPEAGSGAGMAVAATTEKLNPDHFQWPRIYISLSRKEKEDDFLAMKGTKLPQRPKKRAKNIDRTLQYCFPGMWLSDLTRGRYEVREKKCAKKQKLRGLKGMESMHSDSE